MMRPVERTWVRGPGAVVLCAAEQNVALVIVVDGQILPDQLVDARFERGNIDIRLMLVEFEHEAVADIAPWLHASICSCVMAYSHRSSALCAMRR